LITEALTASASYTLNDSYDVVYKVEEFALTATSFVINPIQEIQMQVRPQTIRGYDGRLVQKSWAQVSPLLGMHIEFPQIAITEANYKKLCLYVVQGARLALEESTGASAVIPYYAGKVVNASHLPTRFKSARAMMWIDYECEIGTTQ
jgi:hypothetical protein